MNKECQQSPEAHKSAAYGFCFEGGISRVSSSYIQEVLSNDSIGQNGKILG